MCAQQEEKEKCTDVMLFFPVTAYVWGNAYRVAKQTGFLELRSQQVSLKKILQA